MSKTPVSILQEMMTKKQIVPNYELIHDGGGTHMNTFVYQVTCDGLRATGTGRCKKDAKHEAAKAMLEKIVAHRGYPQLPASPAQSPVRSSLPATVLPSPRLPANMPFHNAVGALQGLCADNNLQEPEYRLISDVGPPHARVFTIQCIVSTFKEEGIATTKKQAKHESAKKMLDKINYIIGDLKLDQNSNAGKDIEEQRKEIIANEIAKARYPALSKLATSKKVNLGLKMAEAHLKFRTSMNDETREILIKDLTSLISDRESTENVEDSLNHILPLLKEYLTPLNLEISNVVLESTESDIYIVGMYINTCPEIWQISTGKTMVEATFSTVLRLINSMLCLLK